jgi:hypothetical protein
MGWRIVKRKLGRAGGVKERSARQRGWDRLYGEGFWAIGYKVGDRFLTGEEANLQIYQKSYEQHFLAHQGDLEELISTACALRNPHALATSGVDLQVPAILGYLEKIERPLRGQELVDIGTWQGQYSHALSVRLSPLQIKAWGHPKMTLEKFWQSHKCLALWD